MVSANRSIGLCAGKGPENQEEDHEKEKDTGSGIGIHPLAFLSVKYPVATHIQRLPESAPAMVEIGYLYQQLQGIPVGNITETGRIVPGLLLSLWVSHFAIAAHQAVDSDKSGRPHQIQECRNIYSIDSPVVK